MIGLCLQEILNEGRHYYFLFTFYYVGDEIRAGEGMVYAEDMFESRYVYRIIDGHS
jgi:hypothetical protein